MLSARESIAIEECGEPLSSIQSPYIRFATPHPYFAAGAPYAGRNPFSLRESLARGLEQAAESIYHSTGLFVHVFDAYRPVSVQAYMRQHTFEHYVQATSLDILTLTPTQTQALWSKVDEIWAPAVDNPQCPPPHATGAAVDLTLCQPSGELVDMGSRFDEAPPRSLPNHYAESDDPDHQRFHQMRELLSDSMDAAGFVRMTHEWWHFSYGDQFWALMKTLKSGLLAKAIYGTAIS